MVDTDGNKKALDSWEGAKTLNDKVLPELQQVENIKDLEIEVIAGLLVGILSNHPETTRMRCEKLHRLTRLTFDLAGGGQGRVIGKGGHTLKAIQSICKSIERSRGGDVIIEVPSRE